MARGTSQKCAEPWMAEPKRPMDGLEASSGKYPWPCSELKGAEVLFFWEKATHCVQTSFPRQKSTSTPSGLVMV